MTENKLKVECEYLIVFTMLNYWQIAKCTPVLVMEKLWHISPRGHVLHERLGSSPRYFKEEATRVHMLSWCVWTFGDQ